jgi:hypothetical protein
MNALVSVVRVAYMDGAGRGNGAVESACAMHDVNKPVGWMDGLKNGYSRRCES